MWWLMTTLECWRCLFFVFDWSNANIFLNSRDSMLIFNLLTKSSCIWTISRFYHILLLRLKVLFLLNLFFLHNFYIAFQTLIEHRYILSGFNLIFLLILVIVIFNYWLYHVVCVHLHNIEETVVVDISNTVVKAMLIRVYW